MKLIEESGCIFILKEGKPVYIIDQNENKCGSKEFDEGVSLQGLQWEEF